MSRGGIKLIRNAIQHTQAILKWSSVAVVLRHVIRARRQVIGKRNDDSRDQKKFGEGHALIPFDGQRRNPSLKRVRVAFVAGVHEACDE